MPVQKTMSAMERVQAIMRLDQATPGAAEFHDGSPHLVPAHSRPEYVSARVQGRDANAGGPGEPPGTLGLTIL
jgi:hypothetical protein